MTGPHPDPLDDDFATEAPLTRIVCAAIRHNCMVICGARHYDPIMRTVILNLIDGRNECPNPEWYAAEQGFIDNRGQFWNREEAWTIAEKAGQIRNRNVSGGKTGILHSEHLY